ncbi:hypothetical protein KSS87_014239 [Heliosperma pusillum]|nr:hypothetical protein KSS87_014239 [Heliosperma pusillum]
MRGKRGNLSLERRRKVFPADAAAEEGFSGGGESEHDLGIMVSDFLENGSGGTDSLCSSDGDSGFSDLHLLADKLSFIKRSVVVYESDLQSVVHSLLLSMGDKHLHLDKSGLCSASCIRYALVKLLKSSGYDAAVCASKWQGGNKVPGGDYEYIDVVHQKSDESSERLIIDIDFRSHFEIARAVESYDKILKSLPVVFVGTLTKLNQFLQVMADASRVSLKQNSMPLPPWRSLPYLQSKWHSSFHRNFTPEEKIMISSRVTGHKQCSGHLRRLQASLQALNDKEKLLKPINIDTNRRLKIERKIKSNFKNL